MTLGLLVLLLVVIILIVTFIFVAVARLNVDDKTALLGTLFILATIFSVVCSCQFSMYIQAPAVVASTTAKLGPETVCPKCGWQGPWSGITEHTNAYVRGIVWVTCLRCDHEWLMKEPDLHAWGTKLHEGLDK